MATTPTLIVMAITHTPMVIMAFGRGVRVTGVMVDGGELGFRDIGGIADSTFCGTSLATGQV
jgi:hypothetical protein